MVLGCGSPLPQPFFMHIAKYTSLLKFTHTLCVCRDTLQTHTQTIPSRLAAVILTTWQPLCRPHACKPRMKSVRQRTGKKAPCLLLLLLRPLPSLRFVYIYIFLYSHTHFFCFPCGPAEYDRSARVLGMPSSFLRESSIPQGRSLIKNTSTKFFE